MRRLGNPPSADRPCEREDEGDGAAVPLAVLAEPDEEVLVADQVAQQTRDDDCGYLADAQAAAVDDLARGLEAEQGDGGELGEVDVVRIAPRWVRAVDDAALDDGRRHDDADGLEGEGEEQGASETAAADELVQPREGDAAEGEAAQGTEGTRPTVRLVVLAGGTECDEDCVA